MIINEEGNVRLTDEQVKAIDVANQRLYGIHNEINSATRTLSALKNDSVVALKDKTYQEEQLSSTVTSVQLAISHLNQVNESVASKTVELSDITQKIAVKGSELVAKENELIKREAEISLKEEELVTRETALTKAESDHDWKKNILEAKISRINEAING